MLKKIEAIIREDKVNDVKDALSEIGIVGLNIFEIRGHGRQGGIKLAGRSGTYMVDMLPKIQVNIVLSDRNLEAAIEAILSSAYTGEQGDGLIFVCPVEDVIRIRTRERGQKAR
jgi:nitrogen regulatory protein P-II 1